MAYTVYILTSAHPPFDTRIFHKQAKTLVENGYNATLIAQHIKNDDVAGIKILALPRSKNRFRRFLGFGRIYKLAYTEKVDVYHFHDPELLPLGLLLKITTKAKVIYDVHEDYRETILLKNWIPAPIRKPLARSFNFIEKWISSRLDCAIAATDNIADNFKDIGHVTTIKNYPVLKYFESRNAQNPEQPILIYAGVLSQIRGISEIIRSMSLLPAHDNARLILCGRFEPEDYYEEVRRLKGYERVEYAGWITPEASWHRMEQSTVGLVCLRPTPNHVRSLPIKMFEYMAAGLPVIASNFPLWKEIVESSGCGLIVDPLNPQEIADAIEYLISHPAEAKAMGENGRKAVSDKFNWENESRKLLDLYDRLLSDRRHASGQ